MERTVGKLRTEWNQTLRAGWVQRVSKTVRRPDPWRKCWLRWCGGFLLAEPKPALQSQGSFPLCPWKIKEFFFWSNFVGAQRQMGTLLKRVRLSCFHHPQSKASLFFRFLPSPYEGGCLGNSRVLPPSPPSAPGFSSLWVCLCPCTPAMTMRLLWQPSWHWAFKQVQNILFLAKS